MSKVKIFTDGGSRGNPGPSASAFVIEKDSETLYKEGKFLGRATNNVAEYNAVLMALKWLKENEDKFDAVEFVIDSELVVRQLNGVYKIKNLELSKLASQIMEIKRGMLMEISFSHVKRHHNKASDKLVNETLDKNMSRA